jgi:hypothetical protein
MRLERRPVGVKENVPALTALPLEDRKQHEVADALPAAMAAAWLARFLRGRGLLQLRIKERRINCLSYHCHLVARDT